MKNELSINIHVFSFLTFAELDSWVGRMPIGIDCIEIWADIINQLSLFFRGRSSFSEDVIKAVRADPSFMVCNWAADDIDSLVWPIQVHVDA